jgi:serine/threonine protein kinase
LAPECYNQVITFKLDIYSLGVIILEILTGQKGYVDVENVRTVYMAINHSGESLDAKPNKLSCPSNKI